MTGKGLIGLLICGASLCLPLPAAAAEETDFDKYLRSSNIVIIQSQKYLDAGEYDNALKLLDLGIAKYTDKDVLYALKGETLYKNNRLEEAERGGPVFLDTNLWKISGSLLSV